MTEWSKVQHWKCCVLLKGTVGSNPTLSASLIDCTAMDETVRAGAWFVYVLFSPGAKRTYVGCTHDVNTRLAQHNRGEVSSTQAGKPTCPAPVWFAVLRRFR